MAPTPSQWIQRVPIPQSTRVAGGSALAGRAARAPGPAPPRPGPGPDPFRKVMRLPKKSPETPPAKRARRFLAKREQLQSVDRLAPETRGQKLAFGGRRCAPGPAPPRPCPGTAPQPHTLHPKPYTISPHPQVFSQ